MEPEHNRPRPGRAGSRLCRSHLSDEHFRGEVSLEVVIDGATYTYSIPQILWEAGKRYIYSVTMRSNDAEIGGENGQSVTIEGWTSTEEDITLVPVK